MIQPHDDDGIIAIGGTIIRLLRKGWEGVYVYMTDGRHGSQVIPPSLLKKIREREAQAERKFLGIKESYAFNVEDGNLFSISEKEKKAMTRKLVKILRRVDVIFLPSKADHHIDHRTTYQLAKKSY